MTSQSDGITKPADVQATNEDATGLPPIPDYLQKVYYWAYLNPRNVRLLDRRVVVWAILWGNDHRLQRAAFEELEPGIRVLQPASVYGDFAPNLAKHLGPDGKLDVVDVAPVQVESCRRKLTGFPHASVRVADAVNPGGGPYDAVCCFFLLHEVPSEYRRKIVDSLLGCIEPGGKVVFIDYHKAFWWHPLKGFMGVINRMLEPFVQSLIDNEIKDFASNPEQFTWTKKTYFGGLYQKTVAQHIVDPTS